MSAIMRVGTPPRAAAVLSVAVLCSCERAPLTYMVAAGPAAEPVVKLGWGLTLVSCAVIALITVLVLAAIYRRRPALQASAQLRRSRAGLPFVYVGVAISTVVLFICSTWSLITLAHVARIPHAPAVVLDVIGHQWWWEVRYRGTPLDRSFSTANEMHIPVGQPVEVHLSSADVIHSFWVPRLAGKTDTIPGQTNVTWLQASAPGTYFGQCTEYCGVQHAHMALVVVAEPPERFAAWWDHQLQASPPPDALAAQGEEQFMRRCAVCHTVRGTLAGGVFGPNLSHLAQRQRIVSGTLPNTREALAQWVAHPQSLKPGSLMLDPTLDAAELSAILAFLASLQ